MLAPMDLPDEELVRGLTARDGPLRARFFSHRGSGSCRYAAVYPEGCPWCAAEDRRREREQQAART